MWEGQFHPVERLPAALLPSSHGGAHWDQQSSLYQLGWAQPCVQCCLRGPGRVGVPPSLACSVESWGFPVCQEQKQSLHSFHVVPAPTPTFLSVVSNQPSWQFEQTFSFIDRPISCQFYNMKFIPSKGETVWFVWSQLCNAEHFLPSQKKAAPSAPVPRFCAFWVLRRRGTHCLGLWSFPCCGVGRRLVPCQAVSWLLVCSVLFVHQLLDGHWACLFVHQLLDGHWACFTFWLFAAALNMCVQVLVSFFGVCT